MLQQLNEVLNQSEANYLLPFFWMHQGHTDSIPERIRQVRESGCRALCVESRPHEDFCGPLWWQDMDVILSEAEQRDMQVWILDDKHFPTGIANEQIQLRYPELRRAFLREFHVDVLGPQAAVSFLIPPPQTDETLIQICAWQRSGKGETLTGKPVMLKPAADSHFLRWDVPAGCWRIFYIYKRLAGPECGHLQWSIDMLSQASVRVLIDAVYEPHYQHYQAYFGKTIAGFFSDEPGFYAPYLGPWGQDSGSYYRSVGQPGVGLPWNDALAPLMESAGVGLALSQLPLLWYEHSSVELTGQIRSAYMDALTRRWEQCFSWQLGDWCRSHQVQYIGHVIEDMDAGGRVGCAGGHYFRSLSGQDMSGIDIVLHQVMPGMADFDTAAAVANGRAGAAFFQYSLAHQGSSLARLTPQMHNRAMCEEFGAFGWAEGVPFMQWITDFLLVRGINHFVPHAFTDLYPDPDCPPHFYAQGNDPSFPGFAVLMHYTNQMAHLLSQAERQTAAAILYHAEAEWISGLGVMPESLPAKALYDAQIDYDIVSADMLAAADVRQHQLLLNGHAHRFLVVPEAPAWPTQIRQQLQRINQAGVPVLFVGKEPAHQGALPGLALPISQVADYALRHQLAPDYAAPDHQLRIADFVLADSHIFMLHQEATLRSCQGTVQLPVRGRYLKLDLLRQKIWRGQTESGRIQLDLAPGQAVLYLFGGFEAAEWLQYAVEPVLKIRQTLNDGWSLSYRESGLHNDLRPVPSFGSLTDLNAILGRDGVSGQFVYTLDFDCADAGINSLDLGQVGQIASVSLNGKDLGWRISAPYQWELESALCPGSNRLEVTVANTLVQRLQDPLSCYMPIPATGLLGPVCLLGPAD